MRKGFMRIYFVSMSLGFGALLYSASPATQAQAAVIEVPGVDNMSIQDCIDAASVTGDTCLVSDGIYNENLSIAKGVTLKSVNGAGATTINGGCAGPVISIVGYLDNYRPIVDGFTIVNGCAPHGSGGGISFTRGEGEIRNSIITGNSAAAGGGIAVHGATVTITNCEIIKNNATGTVDTTDTASCLTTGPLPLQGGGGVLADCMAGLTLNTSEISRNTSAGDAGGIFAYQSTLTVNFSKITKNTSAAKAGGIYNAGTNSVFMSWNSLIACNYANLAGGFYNQSGAIPAVLVNTTVAGNTAAAVGGVFSWGGSPISFVNTIVHQNFPRDNVYDEAVTCSAYSNIDTGIDGTVIRGEENINENPLFVDPAGCDFHLREDSPCVNAGTNFPVCCFNSAMPTQDLDGTARPQGLWHDMGAYELPAVNCREFTDQGSCDARPECEWVMRGSRGLCGDYVPPEICGNGIDDNANGMTDCDDIACWDVCPPCEQITDQASCEIDRLCEWDGTACINTVDECTTHDGDSATCKTEPGCSYDARTDTCNAIAACPV